MTSRFWENFGLIAVTNVVTPLFAVVLVLAISRLSGPELLGKYSLLMAVLILGQTCASLGLAVIVTREVAVDRARGGAYFVAASLVGLAIVAVALLVAVPTLWLFLPDAELRMALVLILVSLLPSVVTGHAEALLLGLEESRPFVGAALAERILGTVASTLLVIMGYGIVAIAVVVLVLRVLAAVVLVMAVVRRTRIAPRTVERDLCWQLVRQVPVLGLIPVVNAVYSRLDVLLLGAIQGFTELGVYSAAARLVDLAKVLPMAYSRALYPVISRLRAEGDDRLREVLREAMRGLTLLACLAVLLMSATSDWVVHLLYGSSFAPAGWLLRVLAWSVVPFAVASILAQVLFAANLAVLDLRVNVTVLIFNAALNVVAIEYWGAAGAAVAAVASAVLYAILQYGYVATRVLKPAFTGLLTRISAAAAFGWAAGFYALWLSGTAVAGVALTLSAYTGALVWAGLIGRRDVLATYGLLSLWVAPRRSDA